MSMKLGTSPRGRFTVALALALAVAVALAVPLAMANTATPVSTQSTWSYVNGNSGAVKVIVTGNWNWATQTCIEDHTLYTTYVDGHWAVGLAGSWNDSTTPNTVAGKDTNSNPVALHVGNSMDQTIGEFCANATKANPSPSGIFRIEHQYPSLAAFQTAAPNGQVCVNAYDIHTPNQSKKDWNPGLNTDNAVTQGNYDSNAACSTASQTNADEDLSVVNYERIGSGNWDRGPIQGVVGEVVDYKSVVTNTGNVPLDVTFSDADCDAATPSGSVTLAPGDSQAYYCSHQLKKFGGTRYINTATAHGQNSNVSPATVNVSSWIYAKVGESGGGVKGVHHTAHPTKPVVRPANFAG